MKIEPVYLILIVGASLLVGALGGVLFGVQLGQQMIWNGLAISLSGSNVELNMELNETEIVDLAYNKLEPYLNIVTNNSVINNFNTNGVDIDIPYNSTDINLFGSQSIEPQVDTITNSTKTFFQWSR